MGSYFSSSSPSSSDPPKYGDIMKVSTTGASRKTAQQDKLGCAGVSASHTMAKTDQERMGKYKSIIYTVGEDYDIHPALIAAIISRESRAGATIEHTGGWGDWDQSRNAWNAFGLMQVDVNPKGGNHRPDGKWDSEEHLRQATGILVDFIERIRNKFPNWSREEQLKGGIAAYNMGDGNVRSKNVDESTTGGDYANDVVARAQWYRNNG
ncbi:lysozyme g-like isoform X2 [Trachinotus anak]|uniref:lysozyme g-like isoform X2 n=1 Tax=Trachinotus anak TaxID=443729 RepID=UPI0039F247DA